MQQESEVLTTAELKDMVVRRNIKDSVFTNLFADPKYVLQLYQALHPEDHETTVDDIVTVTLEYDLLNQDYNDLGFLVDDRLIVLVEAQSQWSDNIIIRCGMYLMQTWKNYIETHDSLDLHSTVKVALPKPELYVIYTGDKKFVKEQISYQEEFMNGEPSAIDIRVKVIRDSRQGDIINQYIRFTKVLAEQIAQYGRTREAVMETIRICKNEDVLKEYLKSREKEVISIMISLYDFDRSLDKKIRVTQQESLDRGRAEGEAKKAKECARMLHREGMPLAKIAMLVGNKMEVVKQWLAEDGQQI